MNTEGIVRPKSPAAQRKSARSKRPRQIAVAVIAASLLSLGVALYQPGPVLEAAPHQALGKAVAAEAIKLIGTGGKVILIERDTTMFKSPATRVHLKTFTRTLLKAAHPVAATNVIKVDPLRPLLVPPGSFYDLLRRTTEADVVVSFLGPPLLSPEQVSQLGNQQAKVIAFCPGGIPHQSNLSALIQNRLVQTAIVDREVPLPKPPKSAPLEKWFEQRYLIVTAANLSGLTAQSNQ